MREAAEGLNLALRKLVEAQDDQPTPTVEQVPMQSQIGQNNASSSEPQSDSIKSARYKLALRKASFVFFSNAFQIGFTG